MEVPSVINKSVNEAKAMLEDAGLTVMTVNRKPTQNESQMPRRMQPTRRAGLKGQPIRWLPKSNPAD